MPALQMYESEEGDVLEEELALILEMMLGVKEVQLPRLRPDTGRITYGKTPVPVPEALGQIIYRAFVLMSPR